MKKTMYFFLLGLLLIFHTGCTNSHMPAANPQTSSIIQSDEETESQILPGSKIVHTNFEPTVNGIPVGLSPEELLSALRQCDLELVPADNTGVVLPEGMEMIQDGRAYNNSNDCFSYSTTNGIHFQYDADGKFYSFSTRDSNVATAEGLKVGDTTERLFDLYGENYDEFQNYNYSNGSQFLIVKVENGHVAFWEIAVSEDLKVE